MGEGALRRVSFRGFGEAGPLVTGSSDYKGEGAFCGANGTLTGVKINRGEGALLGALSRNLRSSSISHSTLSPGKRSNGREILEVSVPTR